jgi:hypothetical protein
MNSVDWQAWLDNPIAARPNAHITERAPYDLSGMFYAHLVVLGTDCRLRPRTQDTQHRASAHGYAAR